jgi:hypothetical protein
VKACWVPINPDPKSNQYLATPGGRYAVLLSVDSRGSMSDVTDELKKNNFTVTYSWQSGQPTRNQFDVDNWLANLPKPTSGTNWMYFEMNFTGDSPQLFARSFQKCVNLLITKICGNVDVAYLFEAQQVADNFHPCGPGDPVKSMPNCPTCPDLPPPCPAAAPAPTPFKPLVGGLVVGGLVAGLSTAWWYHHHRHHPPRRHARR